PAAFTTGGMWSLAITETGNSFGMVASTEDTTGYEKPRLVLVTGAAATDSDADGIPDAIDPDDDNDGIPDEHEVLLGLDPLLSSDAAADGDIDGFPNFLEYALGGSITEPTPASHYLSIAPAAGGNTTLTLRRRAGLPGGIAVRIAFSGDLASWDAAAPEALAAAGFTVLDTSTSVENDLIGPVETLSITLAARATPTWFRAQVTAGP
ncbi:MAG: hypothetical protein KDN05_10940, partial [Verrucomicrobiae bacterium]|nr:hypothetical protein [Verrucomicrobiae bacterium]